MTLQEQISLLEAIRMRLGALKQRLRKKYPRPAQQVTNAQIKDEAKIIASDWLTKLTAFPLITDNIEEEAFANLSVEFQRLYTSGEKSAKRTTYESIFRAIDKLLTGAVVLSIKAKAGAEATAPQLLTRATTQLVVADKLITAFVGHSFETNDSCVVRAVIEVLNAIGVQTFTGEKPKAERISEKVKSLIESQELFVGLFTRRERLQRRDSWTTTPWVIEEKAYAIAKKRALILLWEDGVVSIGGMHGDQEYIPFDRTELSPMLIKLIQMFRVRAVGLQ